MMQIVRKTNKTFFYVCVDSPCGTTIIGKYFDLLSAVELKAEIDLKWSPDALWSTRIVQKEIEVAEIAEITSMAE